MTKPLYYVNGVAGSLEVHADHVSLTPKGVLGAMTRGFAGTKRIPFSSITALQLREPGQLGSNGFLQFTVLGSVEASGGLMKAVRNENTFLFGKSEGYTLNLNDGNLTEKMREITSFIEKRIGIQSQGQALKSINNLNGVNHKNDRDDRLADFLQDDQSSQMWIMRPDGKIGGPFTSKKLDELKSLGKLPSGLKASHSKEGPWKLFPTISNQQSSDDAQLEAVVSKEETAATPVPPPFSSITKPFALPRDDVPEVASRQKQILLMILITIPASFIPFGTLVTGVIQIYFIFKLADAVGSSKAWLYAILVFFPLIGLFALLHLNGKATKILKDNGVDVGLMGAKSADLKKYQNKI